MAKKKTGWFKTTMAVVGGLAVTAGIIFSVLWFVPSIHDRIWTPTSDQTEVEPDADKTLTEE